MYTPAHVDDGDPLMLGTNSKNALGVILQGNRTVAPSSATLTGNRAYMAPFYLSRGYSLARWWWQNGATVGTDYIETGIYDENFNLFRASPRTLSAGTANQLQFANPGVHGANVTSGGLNASQSTFTTASVTLKAGVLYLMSVCNKHGTDAHAVSSIDSGPTFTSRSTTQFFSNLRRTSIWSAVPTTDYTGTLVINFGANTETACAWSLDAFYHVDTATSEGIVQQAVGTGSSVTPLATLSAYGSSQNAGYGAFGLSASINGAPTSTATVELADTFAVGGSTGLQTTWARNDTTMDETIASNGWGACAVEIKSLGTGAVYVPPMRGWLAFHMSGTTTATAFRTNSALNEPLVLLQSSLTGGLPTTATPALAAAGFIINHGFTRSTSP